MATVQTSKTTDETPAAVRQSEIDTGERDEHFDLISVLYHALQGAETTARYVHDAERRGDEQLAQFFVEVRGSYVETAQQAKQLLAMRLDPTDELDDH
jgi:hypothetical protein